MNDPILVSGRGANLSTTRQTHFGRVIEALCLLILFDALASTTNFGRIQRWVRSVTRREEPQEPVVAVEDIAAAVNVACTYYPKTVACLQRSSAIARMLRRRGIPAAIVIGVQLLPFASHAWVEVDGVVVNDKARVKEAYAELHRI